MQLTYFLSALSIVPGKQKTSNYKEYTSVLEVFSTGVLRSLSKEKVSVYAFKKNPTNCSGIRGPSKLNRNPLGAEKLFVNHKHRLLIVTGLLLIPCLVTGYFVIRITY